ncbi:MAG: hypothetical protein ACOC1I_01675 [Spirochaetota bacterium]
MLDEDQFLLALGLCDGAGEDGLRVWTPLARDARPAAIQFGGLRIDRDALIHMSSTTRA